MNSDYPIYVAPAQALIKNVTEVQFIYAVPGTPEQNPADQPSDQAKPPPPQKELTISWVGADPDLVRGYKVSYRERDANDWIETTQGVTQPPIIIAPEIPLVEGLMYEFKFITVTLNGRETYPYFQGFIIPIEEEAPVPFPVITRDGLNVKIVFNGTDQDQYAVVFGPVTERKVNYDTFLVTGKELIIYNVEPTPQRFIMGKLIKDYRKIFPVQILN